MADRSGENSTFYTVTLDRAGGTGGSAAIYGKRSDGTATTFYTDEACTVQIGANGVKVQVPTRTNHTFTGYWSAASGGTKYVSDSGNIINSLSVSADTTLYARWTANTCFGTITDFFNYGSANLVPIESDSGENKPRIVTRHYGKFLKRHSPASENTLQQVGADAASSPIWRNPTVKYLVVGNVNFAIQLGKAWAGVSPTFLPPTGYTGYMITSVVIDTRMHNFPTITVSAVANEGVDAINQFDIGTFGNIVSVLPRARAQALMNAINPGTGHLQGCTLKVSCDPVVLAENMVPCASDVVNGRIEVSADVLFTDVNNRTVPSAGTGFTLITSDATRGGTAYNAYRIAARKEL